MRRRQNGSGGARVAWSTGLAAMTVACRAYMRTRMAGALKRSACGGADRGRMLVGRRRSGRGADWHQGGWLPAAV